MYLYIPEFEFKFVLETVELLPTERRLLLRDLNKFSEGEDDEIKQGLKSFNCLNFKCWRFSSKGLVKVFRLSFRRNAVLMISSWLKQRRIGNLDLQKLNQSCFGEENRQ